MIDWSAVARHALWISGAATAVSAWSYGRVDGFTAQVRLALKIGALLFCVGLALVTPLWQAVLWTAIALFIAFGIWKAR